MSKSIANKILTIGWGTADWKVIDPMMKKGLLPNVQQLFETGARAKLGTLDPPIPTANWTTINTGKAPIKHGIHTFTEPGKNANTPITSKGRQASFLWEILSRQGMKAHQIGATASYPVTPISGVSVSDLFFENIEPAIAENLVFPTDKYDDFIKIKKQAVKDAQAEFYSWEIASVPDSKVRFEQLSTTIKEFLAQSFATQKIALDTLENGDWNSLNIYFTRFSDIVHTFTPYSFSKNKDIPRQLHQAFKEVLYKCYQLLDKMLGELLQKAGEDAIVMLLSQGGLMPHKSYIDKLAFNDSTYEYNTQGLLIIRGKQAFEREELYAVTALDISLTTIALLGHPLPKDFDGKPLLAPKFFERINKFIDTYEPEASKGEAKKDSPLVISPNYEKRLQQLGYVTDKIAEQQEYFKSRVKIASGLQPEVIPYLERLHKKYPKNSWYGGRLAGSYLATNQIKQAVDMLDKVVHIGHEIPELHILRGNLFLMEMKYRSAAKQYDIADKNAGKIPNLYSQIAEGYAKIQQWNLAEKYFKKEIEINPHPSTYFSLASTFLQRKMMKKAIPSLEKTVELAPAMSVAWYHLGSCRMQAGEYQAAADALEEAKKNNRDPRLGQQIQQGLIVLYRDHLDRKDKIKEMQDAYERSIGSQGTITIVSGLPRSGTSMMMQMLVNGGMQAFTDGNREADDNNKKGYFEHDAIKALGQNKQILTQVGDKVVKIISHLLHHLPHVYKYKIIFMDRAIEEVMNSQHKMLGRLGKERGEDKENSMALLKTFEDSRKKAIGWCKNHPKYVEYTLVPYHEAVSDPVKTAKQVNEFLGGSLDEKKMVGVVDASLYREKVETV